MKLSAARWRRVSVRPTCDGSTATVHLANELLDELIGTNDARLCIPLVWIGAELSTAQDTNLIEAGGGLNCQHQLSGRPTGGFAPRGSVKSTLTKLARNAV
jgi:hypothetical protein